MFCTKIQALPNIFACIKRLFCAFVAENGCDSAEDNLNIHRWSPVLYIVYVKGATLIKRDIATTRDLREASYARFDRKNNTAIAVVFKLGRLQSARAD